MKKFYTFLTAIVVSMAAVAQSSITEFYGDWTFTFQDVDNGNAVVTKVMTLNEDSPIGEMTFQAKDEPFFIVVEYASLEDGNITFRFGRWDSQFPAINGKYPKQTLYYLDFGDEMTITQAQGIYNIAENKATKFLRKNFSNAWVNEIELGVKFTNYTNMTQTESDAACNYIITNMQFGAGEEEKNYTMSDFYGDWTFTFQDVNNGNAVVTKVMTLNEDSPIGEITFQAKDEPFFIVVEDASLEDGNITFRFGRWDSQFPAINGKYPKQTLYYLDFGDEMTITQAQGIYNIAENKATKFLRKNFSNAWVNEIELGVKFTNYTNMTQTESDAAYNYIVTNMQFGAGESGDNNSIAVSVPYSLAYPTSLTTAQIFAQVEAEATGFDEFDVWYNLYLEDTQVVPDTKVVPDYGEYLIYAEDLIFERNYTLKVWATSGDYVSPAVTELIWTGSAPDIRVSAKADNITSTSADITVTTNYWDIEYGPVMFTISAESANGTEVDPIEIEDKGSGTFNVTGLAGNTQYTYTINYSAYDQIGATYDKEAAATVTFTTLAPSIELDGISYSPIEQGAAFVVNTVKTEGLAADQTVEVYFQLQDSQDEPAKAEVVDGAYKYTFSNLEPEQEYTAVIFGGVGTYGEADFVQGTVYTESFTTGAASPEITITFPEGSYSSSIESRYYAQIVATPTIEATNAPEYQVYYNLYMGATKYRSDVKVEPTDGEYVITIGELNFSRLYKVEVYATIGEGAYTSEVASFEITTVGEPGVSITKAEAQNITETAADLVVEYDAISLPGEVSYKVSIAAQDAPEVEPVITTDKAVTFNLTGLKPGTLYTYHVTVTADAAGSMYQANLAVPVETLEASQTITLDDISYVQSEGGAVFTVGSMVTEGFDADTEFDVYFQLSDSSEAPAKAELVKDGDKEYYTYTFTGLIPKTPYTAVIFGGTGEYGTDNFFQGEVYTKHFVSGDVSGIETIVADAANVRYFNLQGFEISHPAPGTVCIKVEGNKASKVVVK